MKCILINVIILENQFFSSIFYTKQKRIYWFCLLCDSFLAYFLQTYFYFYFFFFYIYPQFYRFLREIVPYTYFLSVLLTFPCYFHNITLLLLSFFLCYFHNILLLVLAVFLYFFHNECFYCSSLPNNFLIMINLFHWNQNVLVCLWICLPS